MCATLIGGITRLRNDYIRAAAQAGVTLKVLTGTEKDVAGRIGDPDRIILFTNMVSHSARNQALSAAKTRNIPVSMAHSSGVSTLRNQLAGR